MADAARKRLPSAPVVYDQHVRYTDFSALGVRPAYINIVREPVDRLVSSYYYSIQGARPAEALKAAAARHGGVMSIDECMERGERGCGMRGDANLMTAFFCGHTAPCRCVGAGAIACSAAQRRAALVLAKHTLQHDYIAVGLQARLPEFLVALERLLPGAFGGVAALPLGAERRTNYTQPSAATRARLQRLVDLDAELYRFATQLFDTRAAACRKAAQPDDAAADSVGVDDDDGGREAMHV